MGNQIPELLLKAAENSLHPEAILNQNSCPPASFGPSVGGCDKVADRRCERAGIAGRNTGTGLLSQTSELTALG